MARWSAANLLVALLVWQASAIGDQPDKEVLRERMASVPPARILLVPVGGSSHVVFHGALGDELRRRGHTVEMATDGGSEFVLSLVKQTKIPFHNIGNFSFATITDSMLDDSETQDENFGQALWAYWNGTYKQGLTGLRSVIPAFKPDFMIIDNYRAEALDAAEEADIPYAATFNMFGYLGLESAQYAPASPMPFSVHDTSFKSRFIQRVLAPIIFHLQVLPMMRELNQYRRDMGVKEVWDVREQLWGHLAIYKGFFGFEHPIPLSPFAVLAGMPLNAEKRALSTGDRDVLAWIEQSGKDEFVVYAALGSIVFVKSSEFLTIVKGISMVKGARLLFAVRKPLQAYMGEANLARARSFFANRPERFRIEAWVNQDAVLCHDKVRVFVSHAGKHSLAESMACGKPTLCIPFLADQPANALRVEDAGMGIFVDRLTATSPEIAEKITRIVSDDSFTKAAQHLNMLRLRSNGISNAIDAVETMILLGDKHMRTADMHLSTTVAYNIDVYVVAALVLVALLLFVLLIVRSVLRRCMRRKTHEKND